MLYKDGAAGPKNSRRFFLSDRVHEVFLAESLGHVNAQDVKFKKYGRPVLPRGAMIGPQSIAHLASLGIDRLHVYDMPRVSILVIGDGLLSLGSAEASGQTYDFSSVALKSALETMKIRPVFMRKINPEPKKMARLTSFAVHQSDVIIFVIKEFEKNLAGIKKFLEAFKTNVVVLGEKNRKSSGTYNQKSEKFVYILPYDMDHIFKYFETHVRPGILQWMGCLTPEIGVDFSLQK